MSYIKMVFGLLQGLLSFWFIEYPPLALPGKAFVFVLVSIPLFAFQIKLPSRNRWKEEMMALWSMAILYAYITYRSFDHVMGGCDVVLIIQSMASFFILLIFYCVFLEEKRFTFPYRSLFNEAWKTINKIILGSLFALLAWALCQFAGFLFNLISIHAIHHMVSSHAFRIIMPAFFFGLAMSALDQLDMMLIKLRDIALVFCRFLYPICLIMTLGFLLVAPFSSEPIASYWGIISTIGCINIVLFNGVFQAGLSKPPYIHWISPLIGLSFVVLSLFSAYVLRFPISTAIHQGLDGNLFLTLLALTFLALYNIGYTAAWLCSRDAWFGLVKPINTYLALAQAFIYLVLGLLMTCSTIKPPKMVHPMVVNTNPHYRVSVNNDYHGNPSCYIACYSHEQKNSAYSVGPHIYVMGEILVPGQYHGSICIPTGYEGKDIAVADAFKSLCHDKLSNCSHTECWAGGDTGGSPGY